MLKHVDEAEFQSINRGYNTTFRPGRLSLGVVVPLENYSTSPVPDMNRHVECVQLGEELGFSAIWLRDVPFNVPSFGDAGQLFDPFVYLGLLAASTERIALGVASIVLPLRHPAHVAKAAASVDVLSGGRLILGVASGDRPEEYPALNLSFHDRGDRFRESFDYIMHMWEDAQAKIISNWRARVKAVGGPAKPAVQSLYVDLVDDPEAKLQPIHLGLQLGVNHLRAYVKSLEEIGINHVALNLRFNQADIETTLKRLAEQLLPDFSN